MKTRLAFFLAAGLTVVLFGCGSDKGRSLLPVDLQAAAGLTGIDNVAVRVTHGGSDVAEQQAAWAPAAGQPLKLGIYLPSSIDGTVTVDAIAYDAQGNPLGAADKQNATVRPGQVSAPVSLLLTPRSFDNGDAGSPDGRIESDASESADGSRDAAADGASASDAAPIDRSVTDSAIGVDAAAGPDAALGASWSAAENIENDVLAPSYVPKIAIDPVAGHVLAVWQEDTAVKSRRYDATTRSWGDIKTLDDRGKTYGVRVGMGAGGRATAVWYHNGTGTPALEGLWAAHSKDGGSTWGAPVLVHGGPVYFDVALAVSRDGDARVAWQESAMNMNVLWSAYYSNASSAWTGAAAVKASADTNEREPKMVMAAHGTGLLIWNQVDDGGEDSIWSAAFGANEALKPPVLLDNYTTDDAYDADVAISPDGSRGLAMWGQRNGSTNADLWLNEFTSGMGWKGPQKVLTASWVNSPAVAIGPPDTDTVVWAQPLANGKTNLVTARRLDGQGWSATTPIETTNQAGSDTREDPVPRLLSDSAGNLHLAWRRRTSATDQLFGTFTRRYTGGAWQPEQTIGLKTGLATYHPDLAVAEDGRAAIALYYLDPNNTDSPDAFNIFVSLYR